MQKLVLGSGLSLVLIGGAMTAQAQADPTSEELSTSEVKVLNEQSNEATDTTSQTPKVKFDGVDGEAQERAKGYLKIGDIKGESQTRIDPYLKIDTISGESKAGTRPFLKLGDIKGESQTQADPFLKLGDIDGESQTQADPFLKIDIIPGEPKPSSKPFLKIGDIKGESQDTGNAGWKVEEGIKSPEPNQASPTFKIMHDFDVSTDEPKPDEK